MSKLKLVLECAIDLHKHLETEFPKCEFKANVSKGGELVEVILVASPEPDDWKAYIDAITKERREQLNFSIRYKVGM